MDVPRLELLLGVRNLRVLGSAMQCLAKVGKDLSVRAHHTSGLKLCVINEATTVFTTFNFGPSFLVIQNLATQKGCPPKARARASEDGPGEAARQAGWSGDRSRAQRLRHSLGRRPLNVRIPRPSIPPTVCFKALLKPISTVFGSFGGSRLK